MYAQLAVKMKKKKKTASNTSQSSLLLPASPIWNIISFRAKVAKLPISKGYEHILEKHLCVLYSEGHRLISMATMFLNA